MLNEEHELQLKVWQELAVSKQMLMRTAATALNLDPDCSQAELQQALERDRKRIAEAEANVTAARDQARQTIADMERKMIASERALAAAATGMRACC